ncbi:OCIA domain-containing protein 1 [Acipenser oxyrinchus oxyrinchus]|uniref:OCIA domain-containing protein 1 n=1 Tax=Acipenser oxyrinchus oxyrinchus TaxID=40147 RepID=A0AAD8GJU6_ACIOX|nr:OCIA domain-containing protein 1 [Acipenser oxyrinchus oxyrinchus]
MSQASAGVGGSHQNPAGMAYVPTEEERRVFRECNQESFWYRSLPFSAMGMLVTQGLISRGIFTSSSRFGSIPKVAFAGVCGYLAGKMSYMKTCQEKFKKLENSPLGEALRQGHRTFPPQFAPEKSEFSDAEKPDYQSSFQSVLQPPPTSTRYPDDFSYTDHSLSTYEPAQFGSSPSGAEDLSPQAPGQHIEDETPKKAPIMYEELRNKNRENYEVTMTQKAEVLLKPQQDRAPKTEVKKNVYGDTWDE